MKLKFIGATESVTGSKHLLLTEKGFQVLLDCGLYQGLGKETDELNQRLNVDPTAIDAVILSHAHIDHSGNLPLLCKQGFTGPIYCTPATYDVCKILLLDSAHIHEGDVAFINKKRRAAGREQIRPLYTVKDAEKCLKQFHKIKFDTDHKINDEVQFYFSGNGHIIGSAAVNISVKEGDKINRICYTGDIGRYSDPLLKPPSVFQQADYIICESTYGDRLHDASENAEEHVLATIQRVCVEQQGKLVVPAFSLGRTQEILFVLDNLYNKGKLPKLSVFVDSPLSAKATSIVRKHPECFNDDLQTYLKRDPEPFYFPGLQYIEDVEESKAINQLLEPCIIISASGMCDAGRVKHHLRNTISDSKNGVLITGYCAPGTLGANLLARNGKVHIFGDVFDVRASVEEIKCLSAHADYAEMIKFLSCQDTKTVKIIFLVHGETAAKTSWRETLLREGYSNVLIPDKGEVFEL